MALIINVLMVQANQSNTDINEVEAWADVFKKNSATGTILIVDQRLNGGTYAHNSERAKQRFMPASTFKVPHALIALDTGLFRDEFHVIPWDKKQRSINSWNADQDLRSSMRNSALWVYRDFARQLGKDKEQSYLTKLNYGNQRIGVIDSFWVDNSLKISAVEQVAMLYALYKNELPFKIEHQRLVKDVMINAAGNNWILRAKTGWGTSSEPDIGWWIGWVERVDGPVFFALNMDMTNGLADAEKRKSIAKEILVSIDAL